MKAKSARTGSAIAGEKVEHTGAWNLVHETHNPSVTAVVLTHRRTKLCSQTVEYLLHDEQMSDENVIVLVNGSGGLDQTLEARVHVETLSRNLGPGGGMRKALEFWHENFETDWCYLCEDDVGIYPPPAPRISDLLEHVALLNDRAANPVGAVLAYSRQLDQRTGLTRPHLPDSTVPRLIETDVGAWGATLVSRRVVDAGVLPDRALFFGYEDFDFFLRIRSEGFGVLLDAEAANSLGLQVHPSGRQDALGNSRPIDDTEPWRRYYEARNFLELARRHGNLGWQVTHLLKSARRAQLGTWPHRRAIARGLRDGLFRKHGSNVRYQRAQPVPEFPADQ